MVPIPGFPDGRRRARAAATTIETPGYDTHAASGEASCPVFSQRIGLSRSAPQGGLTVRKWQKYRGSWLFVAVGFDFSTHWGSQVQVL
jgi:hypothetical protein